MLKKMTYVLTAILVTVIIALGIGRVLDNKRNETGKTTVEKFLTLYKNRNGEAGKLLFNNVVNSEITFKGFQGILAEKIEFKIKRVKKEDKGYQVTTEISNIDFGKIFQKNIDENVNAEKISENVKKQMKAKDVPIRKFIVEIPVVEENGRDKVVLTPELSNALLGGYNEYLDGLMGDGQSE